MILIFVLIYFSFPNCLCPCLYYTMTLSMLLLTAAAAKSLQSCPTLCDPTDGSPPGSPVPEILQARTLEWVAILQCVKVKMLSRIRPSATPQNAAFQAPPSMGFSRREYWSGVPLPSLAINSYITYILFYKIVFS